MEHYKQHLEIQEMYATQQRMLEGDYTVEIASLQEKLQQTQELLNQQKEELSTQRDELGAQIGILEWRLREANTRNAQLEAALRHCRGTDAGCGAGTGSGGGATPRRPPSPLPGGSVGEGTPGGLSALSCTLSLSASPYGEVWPFKADVIYDATAFLRSLLESEEAAGQQSSESHGGEHGSKQRVTQEMLAKLPISQRLDLLELAGMARRLEPALLAQGGSEAPPDSTVNGTGETVPVMPGLNLGELSHDASNESQSSMDRARMIIPEDRTSLMGGRSWGISSSLIGGSV